MSRTFVAPIDFDPADADADQNLWELVAGAGDKIKLIGFELTSDATAAASLKLELVRISAAGTGGTAVTEEDVNESEDATATAAVTTDVETPGTQIAVLENYFWEQLGPLQHRPIPEEMYIAETTNGFALRLLTAPGTVLFGGWVKWEEL